MPPTDYECLPRRPAASGPAPRVEPASVASPDKSWEAFVQNHNVAHPRGPAAATCAMLTTDGTADDAYQLGSIQWAKDSRSLSAYRVHADVWRAPGLTGNVKKLIVKGQWTVQ